MFILAINTATSRSEIALLKRDGMNVKVLKQDSWPSENNEAEKLMPAIDALIKDADAEFKSISEVFVVSGPGSFTGLRVGVTVANTIAHLLKAKLYHLNTFEYLRAAAPAPDATLLLFAGKSGVYFEDGDTNINVDELERELEKRDVSAVYGDISEDQKKMLGSVRFMETEKDLGELVSEVMVSTGLETVPLVKPLYVKAPAITKPKKKF